MTTSKKLPLYYSFTEKWLLDNGWAPTPWGTATNHVEFMHKKTGHNLTLHINRAYNAKYSTIFDITAPIDKMQNMISCGILLPRIEKYFMKKLEERRILEEETRNKILYHSNAKVLRDLGWTPHTIDQIHNVIVWSHSKTNSLLIIKVKRKHDLYFATIEDATMFPHWMQSPILNSLLPSRLFNMLKKERKTKK